MEQKTCSYCHQKDHLIKDCIRKTNTKRYQVKWNVERDEAPKASTYPNQYKRPQITRQKTTSKLSYADAARNKDNKNNGQQTNNNFINQNQEQQHNNNNWQLLCEKLERLESGLDNATKMINHLAKNAGIELIGSILNIKPKNTNNDKVESRGSQEFQILNERIEILLQQFANLKNNIKIVAQTTDKENKDNITRMETDDENSDSQ